MAPTVDEAGCRFPGCVAHRPGEGRPRPTPIDQPPAWVKDAVFYQIFPDRFAASEQVPKPGNLEAWEATPTIFGYKGGDLLGVVEHLDWLQDLGINALYLNPIFQSASNHRYHTHDYYQVDPLLGGDDAFRELLDACHERAIRVVLDGVFNHASRGFFQFNDLLENGEQSPWVDWFTVKDWPLAAYASDSPPNYEAWWGIPALPAFNTDNPDVREYLMRVGEHWARQGIDGWRLDVPAEIKTPGFWEEFRIRTRAINPDLYIVGEIWHNARDWIAGGDRFDATMNYLLTSYIVTFVAGAKVTKEMTEGLSYHARPPTDATTFSAQVEQLFAMYPTQANLANMNLLGSHDTPRIMSMADGDAEAAILAAVLLMTAPGAPSVYYGDEIGLQGRKDPDNRRSFPWDDAAQWNKEVLEAYRSLIALRHEHEALRSPGYNVIWPPPGEAGRMLHLTVRDGGTENLLVAVNPGDETEVAVISLLDLPTAGLELVWGRGDVSLGSHTIRLSINPHSGAVWRIDHR